MDVQPQSYTCTHTHTQSDPLTINSKMKQTEGNRWCGERRAGRGEGEQIPCLSFLLIPLSLTLSPLHYPKGTRGGN